MNLDGLNGHHMTKGEYLRERYSLEQEIAFNERLKCRFVAADRRRKLKRLEEEYMKSQEGE